MKPSRPYSRRKPVIDREAFDINRAAVLNLMVKTRQVMNIPHPRFLDEAAVEIVATNRALRTLPGLRKCYKAVIPVVPRVITERSVERFNRKVNAWINRRPKAMQPVIAKALAAIPKATKFVTVEASK